MKPLHEWEPWQVVMTGVIGGLLLPIVLLFALTPVALLYRHYAIWLEGVAAMAGVILAVSHFIK